MPLQNPHDAAPAAHQHVVQTLYAPRAGSVFVCFLGPYRGLITHWVRGESVACLGEADCADAIHRIRPTWKGYAPVRWHNPAGDWWIPAVLEITECFEELIRGRQIRGEIWEVFRGAGKRRTRPVMGRFVEARPQATLWATFDITRVVQRRYHVDRLVWDIPNPVVPRVILPVETGPSPMIRPAEGPAPRTVSRKELADALRAGTATNAETELNGHTEG